MVEPKGKAEKVIPVYEKLEPGSCYIINRTETELLVACNKRGEIKLQRIPIPAAK
jgi:hypothetical protein